MSCIFNHRIVRVLSVLVALSCIDLAYASNFSDTAKVATPTCSTDYSLVRNCHDETLPQAPSLERTAVSAGKYHDTIVDFPEGNVQPGNTYALPHHRTSNDGRLILYGDGGRPGIKVFRPENVGEDHKVVGDGHGSNALYSAKRAILPVVLLHPTRSKLNYEASTPAIYHHTICDDSSAVHNLSTSNASQRNPRYCQAWVSANGSLTDNSNAVLVDGDCYDISVMAGVSDADNRWEMVSNEFTVFVENAKTPIAGSGVSPRPLVYPRMSGTILPFYGFYTYSNAHSIPETGGFDWSFDYARERMVDVCVESPASPRPPWCQFYDTMQTSADHGMVMDKNANGITDSGEYWDGESGRGWAMFEPSVTGDGRLLVINAGGISVWYGYTPNACDISGWKNLRPISAIPWDSRLNNRYPIARAQKDLSGNINSFRDSGGAEFGHPASGGSRMIAGAYPWIDREGRNIIFSRINDNRDHYRFKNITEPCVPGTPAYLCSYNPAIANTLMSPDDRPGKGVSVLGAWTRGKVVNLDHRINFTDFGNIRPGGGFGFNSNNMPAFEMDLFDQSPPVFFQAKASQDIQSYEHLFNAYNALTPRTPFDVVWTVSTDVAQNSEIAFDEYLADNAFIVAHMNAPITQFNCGKPFCPPFLDDGFVPTNPDKSERFDGPGTADFRFRRSPRIQNSATVSGETSCPNETTMDGTRCKLSQWNHHSKIFYFWMPSSEVLYVADYRFFGWLRAKCPDNTKKINRWSHGVRCAVDIPSGYTSTDLYIAANALNIDGYLSNGIAPPATLTALGGTHLVPLGLGGVIGKGLWLDGKNDHIEARFVPQIKTNWFASVWLDNRADDNQPRTVFTWADGSRIAVSRTQLVARVGDTGETRAISLRGVDANATAYYHLGVKSVALGNQRMLPFYVNGTRLPATMTFPDARDQFTLTQELADGRSGFWLGDPGFNGSPLPPFKGWVDELRVYAITSREKPENSYFSEFICNLALGSLVQVTDSDSNASTASMNALYNKAVDYGLILTTTKVEPQKKRKSGFNLGYGTPEPVNQSAAVCEQLVIASHTEPADLPTQASADLICADKVHRNANPAYPDRCLRDQRLQIANKPILADQPRPDFSDTPFCLSCHSMTAPIAELGLDALTGSSALRPHDPRRQPMDVPAVLTGCAPTIAPFNGGCYSDGSPLIMDELFDYYSKVLPKQNYDDP